MPAPAIEWIAPAVVLRAQPVGDADVVAVLLCPTRGRIDAFGRGVRSSRKRFEGAALQPFNVVEAGVQPARKAGMPTLAGAVVRSALLGPSPSYPQLVAGSYLLEMAGQLCQPGHADPPLFRWTVAWIEACGRADEAALPALLAAAELGALSVAGMLVDLRRCARCGASLHAGAAWPAGADGLACHGCRPAGAPWLSAAVLAVLDAAARGAAVERVADLDAATWALVSDRARAQLHHALRGPLRAGMAVADTLRSPAAAPTLAAFAGSAGRSR
ncbi:MAG: DNA repair protein RecO C-terminal domain-containing protein [Deltaproteobacteria bacterium]|nr:DNA repair protein RecO C-terminal domain-containing protein [Deltaproteobacteria bacterium]